MKVKLPSDNLTPAQLRQKSGPVESYSLGGPMKWQQLLALPIDLRKRYLEQLRDEYKATTVMLSEMLGCPLSTLRRRCKEWGITFPKTGGYMSEKGRASWAAFLNGEEILPEEDPAPVQEPAAEKAAQLVPAKGAMTFHGSAGAALRKAYDLLGEVECTLTIDWEQEDLQ